MNHKLGLLSGVALACVMAIPAFAQTAPAAAAAAEADNGMTIIVTAQRRSEKLNEVPVSIIANTAAQLTTAGVVDTRDLATVTPGLSYTTMGAWSNPAIRSVSSTITAPGGEGPNATYVDGIYQPSQQGAFADLPDVDHVEVSKGPQGTLFGRNATGGAIQIFTKGPSFTPHMDLNIADSVYLPGNGSNDANNLQVSAFVSGPIIGDKLAGSFSAAYRDSGGYSVNDYNGSSFGAVNSYIYRGKLLWKPTEYLTINAGAFYTRRYDENVENGPVLNGDGLLVGVPGTITATEPYHVSFSATTPHMMYKEYGGYLKVAFQTDYGTLTSTTTYQKITGDIHVNVMGSAITPAVGPAPGGTPTAAQTCFATLACLDYQVPEPSESMTEELIFTSRKFGPASFIAGVFMYHENAGISDLLNNFAGPNGDYPGAFGIKGGFNYLTQKVATSSVAGFGEGNYDFTDKLHVILGMRYSVDSKRLSGAFFGGPIAKASPYPDKTWWALTPRFSIRYDWTNHFNTYFTVSKGFKSGVFDASTLNTPPLNPEKLVSFEGGAKLSYRNFNFNVAAYWYDYQGLQLEVFQGLAAKQANANAEVFGIDFDGQWKINDHWEVRAGGSVVPKADYTNYAGAIVFATDATHPVIPYNQCGESPYCGVPQLSADGSGHRMIKAPIFTGFASVRYNTDLSFGRLDASVNLYHSEGYSWDVLDYVQTKSFTTVGGEVSLKPNFLPNTKFTIFGKNLTGETYVSGTLIDGQALIGFVNDPREFGVRASYSF